MIKQQYYGFRCHGDLLCNYISLYISETVQERHGTPMSSIKGQDTISCNLEWPNHPTSRLWSLWYTGAIQARLLSLLWLLLLYTVGLLPDQTKAYLNDFYRTASS